MLRFILFTLAIVQLVYCTPQRDERHATVAPAASMSPEPAQALSGCHIRDPSNTEWQNVWRQFLSSGFETYRVAGREDFLFPEDRIYNRGLIVDLHDWMECPVKNGYFNEDRREDYAVFVVDSSQPAPEGLKLVVLTPERDDMRQKQFPGVEVHWVSDTQDLSTCYLSKSRAGLSLSKVTDNGAQFTCSVAWDTRTETYRCVRRRRSAEMN